MEEKEGSGGKRRKEEVWKGKGTEWRKKTRFMPALYFSHFQFSFEMTLRSRDVVHVPEMCGPATEKAL